MSMRLNMLLTLASPVFIGVVLACIGARGKSGRAPRVQANDRPAICRPAVVSGDLQRRPTRAWTSHRRTDRARFKRHT